MIIFPTPLDARCELRHDEGWIAIGVPGVHSSGRPGQVFDIPASTRDGQGAQLTITAPKKVPIVQRGILYLHLATGPGIVTDDFHLSDASATLPRLVNAGNVLAQE